MAYQPKKFKPMRSAYPKGMEPKPAIDVESQVVQDPTTVADAATADTATKQTDPEPLKGRFGGVMFSCQSAWKVFVGKCREGLRRGLERVKAFDPDPSPLATKMALGALAGLFAIFVVAIAYVVWGSSAAHWSKNFFHKKKSPAVAEQVQQVQKVEPAATPAPAAVPTPGAEVKQLVFPPEQKAEKVAPLTLQQAVAVKPASSPEQKPKAAKPVPAELQTEATVKPPDDGPSNIPGYKQKILVPDGTLPEDHEKVKYLKRAHFLVEGRTIPTEVVVVTFSNGLPVSNALQPKYAVVKGRQVAINPHRIRVRGAIKDPDGTLEYTWGQVWVTSEKGVKACPTVLKGREST